jgi:hypothetical protein
MSLSLSLSLCVCVRLLPLFVRILLQDTMTRIFDLSTPSIIDVQIPEQDEIDPNLWGPDVDTFVNPYYALGVLSGVFGLLGGFYWFVSNQYSPDKNRVVW